MLGTFLPVDLSGTFQYESFPRKNNLALSVPEKLENSIFEMLIIPQTLNINN